MKRLTLVIPLLALLLAACGSGHRAQRPVIQLHPRVRFASLKYKAAAAPTVGQVLTTTNGTWTNAPTSYTYQWQDCPRGTCTDITGATSRSFTIQSSDVGDTIDVIVTASNAQGSASQTSALNGVVTRAAFAALHVSGNELDNTSNQPVFLHGVNRSGTEYSCSQNNGFFDGTHSNFTQEDGQIKAMASWGINAEIIGLNEDCWLGINGSPSAYSDPSSSPPKPGCSASQCPYAHAIENLVQTDEAKHIYPVISLFALAPGRALPEAGSYAAHIPLADNSHAPLFWEEVADFFKSDPDVIFRLEQEPTLYNGTESDWQCWAQGDVSYTTGSDNTPPSAPTSTGTPGKCIGLVTFNGSAYSAVGMQSLVNIVRGTGATNVIMLPGLAFANMVSCSTTESPSICGMLDSLTPRVTDPDSDLMAEADVYPEGNACGSVSCYTDTYKPVAETMPFVAGEAGENPANGYEPTTDVDTLMSWLDSNGNGYFPYAWDPWAHLIPSYTGNRTPVTIWGVDYYDHINGITRPSLPQPTDGITFQSTAADCIALPSGTMTVPQTIKAGDHLFAVFGGQGYTSTGSTIAGVSDNVNGAWTELESSPSQSITIFGTKFYVAYSVFELADSKAAPGGLTLTVTGAGGQSPDVSGVAFDARGVASVSARSLQTRPNAYNATFTGPTLRSVPANDVVLGLWGFYSTGETYTVPAGWNTHPSMQVATGQCSGAAWDWTQPSSTGSVAARIDPSVNASGDEPYYGAALDLHP